MAFNFLDDNAVNKARQEAIDAGYTSDEVDKFILGKKALQQETQLYSEGKIRPEDLTSEKRQELSLEAAKRGMEVKGLPTAEDKKQQEKKQNLDILAGDLSLFKNNYENIWTKGPVLGRVANQVFDPDVAAFNALKSSLAFSLAGAIAGQVGRAISDQDREIFENYLPNLTDTPDGAAKKMQNAVQQFKNRMVSAGATEEEINNSLSGFDTGQPEKRKNLLEAGWQDIKDIAAGTAKIAETSVKASPFNPFTPTEEKLKAQSQLFSIAKATPKAVIADATDFVQDPVKWVTQNPVDTILLFLPAISKFKGIKGTTKAAEVANTAGETAGEASKLQKVAEATTEFLNGAGPKEFIAKNVNKDAAQTLAQTALRNDIYGSVTTKGIVENTQKALTDVGGRLSKAYKAAPEITDTGNLIEKIKAPLLDKYPGQENVVAQIVSKIENLGKPVIESNTTKITPFRLWEATINIEEYGLSQFKIGDAGKAAAAMAKDTSRLLRQYLYDKVPDAAPLAIDYGNLKVLMDILPDSEGIANLKGLDQLVGKINFAFETPKNIVNYLSQKLYNLRPPAKIPTVPPEAPPMGMTEIPPAAPVLPEYKTPMSIPRTRAADTSRWTINKVPSSRTGEIGQGINRYEVFDSEKRLLGTVSADTPQEALTTTENFYGTVNTVLPETPPAEPRTIYRDMRYRTWTPTQATADILKKK